MSAGLFSLWGWVQICTINPKSTVDDLFQLFSNGSAISLNGGWGTIQSF
jgi:hypothetical protein